MGNENKIIRSFSMIFFFLFILTITLQGCARKKPNIAVFVIDSESSMMEDQKELLHYFRNVSHGDVIRRIIFNKGLISNITCYNVDDMVGNVSMNKYLGSLRTIRDYAVLNNEKRILVNISLGGKSKSYSEETLIKELTDLGVIIVASAGNENKDVPLYPAAFDKVIGVGSSVDGYKVEYSNYGKHVRFYMDGSFRIKDIDFSFEGDYQVTRKLDMLIEGTSFSAPKVTAVIVLLLSENPRLNNDEIIRILDETSHPVLGTKGMGGREIDCLAAMARVNIGYSALNMISEQMKKRPERVLVCICIFVSIALVIACRDGIYRIVLPGIWERRRIAKVEEIMKKSTFKNKEIKFLVTCLHPFFPNLTEKAGSALLRIGIRALPHLRIRYQTAKRNELVDYKRPIEKYLWSLEGMALSLALREISKKYPSPKRL